MMWMGEVEPSVGVERNHKTSQEYSQEHSGKSSKIKYTI